MELAFYSTSPCYIDNVERKNMGLLLVIKLVLTRWCFCVFKKHTIFKVRTVNYRCIIFVDITEGKSAYQYPELDDPTLYPASNALSGPDRCSTSGYTQTKTNIDIPWWSVNLEGNCAINVLTIGVKGIKVS